MEATVNLLLDALPPAELRGLLAHCTEVELTFGTVLTEPGKVIRYVYFPTTAVISLIACIDARPRLEVGLIGAEGMLGIALLSEVDTAPLRALVQGTGSAARMDAPVFSRLLKECPELRSRLTRYLYVLMTQLAQMTACTRFHLVEARLARWLLMIRDRTGSNRIGLTQEFLANMLGVRRAGITKAAHSLQQRELIRYSRGTLHILNGPGLEQAACECYEADRETYSRVMRLPHAVAA